MKLKILLISIVITLVMFSQSKSVTLQKICLDNYTLSVNETFEYCRNNNCQNVSKITNLICNDGCDINNNECYGTRYERGMGIIAMIGIVIVTFIVFGVMI
jgi:hypothetical protein